MLESKGLVRYSHNHLWSSEPHISEDNLGLLGLLGQRVLLPEELPLLLRHMAGNVSCLYARWVQMEAGILLHWPGNITPSAPPPPPLHPTVPPIQYIYQPQHPFQSEHPSDPHYLKVRM